MPESMVAESEAGERLSIVHLTTFYPPENFGGDGVHVQRLAGALARRGHRVTVIHAPAAFRLLGGNRRAVVGGGGGQDGVRLLRLDGVAASVETLLMQQSGAAVLYRSRLRRFLTGGGGGRPDVIHYHNVSLSGGAGSLSMGRAALKLFTPHEYWFLCPTHLLFRYDREVCSKRTCVRCTLHSGRPPQWWRYLRDPRRALRHVDRILYPSDLTRSVYSQHGIDRPAEVLRHFVPEHYLAGAAAVGPRAAGVEPYFLYAGRLDAVKGVEELLRLVAERALPAPVWLAGGGPLAETLQRRYGEHPGIRLLGHQDQPALAALYRDAIALILPSAGYEVFGQVVVEAYAHGTPALVTRVGGAGELVEGSGAGYVYSTGEELREAAARLADDGVLRDDLGRRGRAYVEQHLREDDYMRRYEQLVREADRR